MQEVDCLISGGWVLTMDESDAEYRDGSVAISGEKIVAVGDTADITRRYRSASVLPATGCIIMPGLINGHTHAAMTCFRGIADDMELMTWLNEVIFPAEANNINARTAFWGSLLACAEMIRSGTTTFSDMYFFEEETARAAKQAGIRCLLGEAIFDFPAPNAKTPEAGLAYTRSLLERWAGDPLVRIQVEPHSLYTCSPSLLAEAKRLADEFQVRLAVHLLENRDEERQIREKLGQRAVSFLEQMGCLNERFIAFHGVCMDEQDIRIFAEHACKVVHNPESNMKLASGVAPISAMLDAGITVGLGTDGCASNNNLDMFQEMDSAAKLEKSVRLDPTIMSARTVLRMATCDGARVLGMDDITGSLTPGKRADVILVDMRKPHLTPMYNPRSHLVYAVTGADVDTVIINGRLVMRNREILTIDEKETMGQIQRIAEGIRASVFP